MIGVDFALIYNFISDLSDCKRDTIKTQSKGTPTYSTSVPASLVDDLLFSASDCSTVSNLTLTSLSIDLQAHEAELIHAI